MKKIFFLLFACGAFAACELETSGNGDLDGFWQLKSVDTLATGTSADMRESGVYWAFQNKMMSVKKINHVSAFLRFNHSVDSLFLSEPYIDNRDSSDIVIDDVELLRPVGINELEERFGVSQLDGGTMVLKSKTLRLRFRKY